ncbi:MAG TPA: RNA polymerase-associated protein RapA [Candidatus Binatia bacterium]|nr:RNA polymerase-associated protein RapA [Candidatus Binatia bacterium]
MRDFRVGQRWVSEAEPELGLGTVAEVGDRHVEIEFPASETRRRYARSGAPIRRARFHGGDVVTARDGRRLVVQEVAEQDGLLVYATESGRIPEDHLSALLGVEGPLERLRRGAFDPVRLFELRQEAFRRLHEWRTSPVRGLAGARIALLPHQLFIAGEVSGREAPRVLLADEVGLGKTIEACLVLHTLLLSGRAERVLVLVPEHLVYQWFVELLRRFNLHFRIFDEERCAAIEVEDRPAEEETDGAQPERAVPSGEARNPFLDEHLVLAGLPLLVGDERRRAQAAEAGWDVLVVDEAHHLTWRAGAPSPEYEAVAAVAARSDAVLLLTGTPSQLGEEGHFARLHLLDPARHADIERHHAEAAAYVEVAREIAALASAASAVPDDGSIVVDAADPAGVDDILDRYGPGRVMFRNTRASIGGFPRRIPHPAPLAGGMPADALSAIAEEVDLRGRRARGEAVVAPRSYAGDPRIPWLAGLLRALAPEKVLLLVQTPEQVGAIADALAREVTVKRAVFHEGLSLVQRDRNAAYFAEKDGARVLLCSEIGSEGRNFQFVHHLVLYDLPLDPELLEQRIGRLDRIGQRHDIAIHVPLVAGSAQEVLFRWYDALDAFAHPLPDGNALHERFGERLAALARGGATAGGARDDGELAALIDESRAVRDELAERLARGRDRLLERSSFRPARASRLVAAVAERDADPTLAEFMRRVLDHHGVEADDLGDGTLRLDTGGMFVDAFPGLPAQGATVTFSRALALEREDVVFLTWDHPMVLGAIDLLVGSPAGTCAFATLEGGPARVALFEATFALESPAPARIGLDRFFPSLALRVVVDDRLADRTRDVDPRELAGARDAASALREDAVPLLREILPAALARARELAESDAEASVERAVAGARAAFARDVERLEALRAVNAEVRPEEIERLRARSERVEDRLRAARPRLDALRILWCAGAGAAGPLHAPRG